MTFTTIENKELRGLTVKQLIWFFGACSSFLIFITTTYFSILNKMDNSQKAIEGVQKSMNEMKEERKGMDGSMNAKINQLENQFYDLQLKQVRYELVLKEKGLMAIE